MANYRHKIGPGRTYAPDELALFARYRCERARCRPKKCAGRLGYWETAEQYDQCWVEHGPPCITNSGRCLGCHGIPRSTTAPGYHGWGKSP